MDRVYDVHRGEQDISPTSYTGRDGSIAIGNRKRGCIIMIGAPLITLGYLWAIIFYRALTVQLPVVAGVFAVMGLFTWIGYTIRYTNTKMLEAGRENDMKSFLLTSSARVSQKRKSSIPTEFKEDTYPAFGGFE